ncbi:24660_t:CDS:2 [Entrophospora sp. SA101]|nr:24660_t:CDS:2 [Entrophospora sp. SA101]CAJ0834356.1 14274_t:CDS:2 [Entrophospora sp. SA101]
MNNKEKTGNYRVICAKYSDGDSSKWPVTHLKQAFDKDHVKFFYELDKNSLLFNSWMERLGQEVTEITKSKGFTRSNPRPSLIRMISPLA